MLLGPIVLLHRHYDVAIADTTDRLERYRRVAAQAPDLRAGARRDEAEGRPPLLSQEHGAEPRRRRVGGPGARAIENNGGRITTSQNPAPRDEGRFRQTFVNVQFFATTPALAKILAALDTQVPYLVVDNLTVRPLNAFRGFKPAPGQEPELNVQLDVSAWAFPEAPKAAARRRRNDVTGRSMNGLDPRCAAGSCGCAVRRARRRHRVGSRLGPQVARTCRRSDAVVTPQPVVVAVLPEYQPVATPATQRDMVERTLFNPTRRPAPVAAAEAAQEAPAAGPVRADRHAVVDGKATAFLRENAGGKSRRVAQGETGQRHDWSPR